jgi:hypothetical protein
MFIITVFIIIIIMASHKQYIYGIGNDDTPVYEKRIKSEIAKSRLGQGRGG